MLVALTIEELNCLDLLRNLQDFNIPLVLVRISLLMNLTRREGKSFENMFLNYTRTQLLRDLRA